MPPPTANEIRAQLKTLLTPVIATSTTKKAKIIEYLAWAFREGSGEDPTNLRSELDQVSYLEGGGVEDRINSLMISERGFGQSMGVHDSSRTETQPRGKNIVTRRFGMAYFYQFGEASELTFSENVEVIRVTLNDNPTLGFAMVTADHHDGPGRFIDGHNGLQVPDMPLEAFGVLAHVMIANLEVRVIEPMTRS